MKGWPSDYRSGFVNLLKSEGERDQVILSAPPFLPTGGKPEGEQDLLTEITRHHVLIDLSVVFDCMF